MNEKNSHLLDRPVANSRYVAISLEGICKLETCIRGMGESQSFSLWALTSIFAFLKDSGCAPEEQGFHQLISNLQISLNSQVKASFASILYLMQKCRETLVSHHPAATHASVKHALLSIPSSSTRFSEDVIRESLAQVKEDSIIKLLKNLSSNRGGKQTTSSPSSSGHRRGPHASTSSSSSSSYSASSSRTSRGSKRSLSSASSPSRNSKIAFKGILFRPKRNALFGSRSRVPRLSESAAGCPFIGPCGGTGERSCEWSRC